MARSEFAQLIKPETLSLGKKDAHPKGSKGQSTSMGSTANAILEPANVNAIFKATLICRGATEVHQIGAAIAADMKTSLRVSIHTSTHMPIYP